MVEEATAGETRTSAFDAPTRAASRHIDTRCPCGLAAPENEKRCDASGLLTEWLGKRRDRERGLFEANCESRKARGKAAVPLPTPDVAGLRARTESRRALSNAKILHPSLSSRAPQRRSPLLLQLPPAAPAHEGGREREKAALSLTLSSSEDVAQLETDSISRAATLVRILETPSRHVILRMFLCNFVEPFTCS